MDPITQGVLGASLSQSVSNKKHLVVAGTCGVVAGMAPDLDVLIRSQNDPLLFLEFHRHFTHSLLFIPLGSLLCALILYPCFTRKRGLSFIQTWLYCTLGYATHGLLDACTSYGTELLWPITRERYAWNIVSVVDPLFTLPIVILLLIAVLKNARYFSRIALIWGLIYLSLGTLQRDRAEAIGWQLAKERQHNPIRLQAKPSLGNLLLWKLVYETDTEIYVDAVRLANSTKIYPGDSIKKLDVQRDLPWLNPDSQQAHDIERFRHFSGGFLALGPRDEFRIIDVRYSMVPNRIHALWGIEVSPSAGLTTHAKYETYRENNSAQRELFINMLLGH